MEHEPQEPLPPQEQYALEASLLDAVDNGTMTQAEADECLKSYLIAFWGGDYGEWIK